MVSPDLSGCALLTNAPVPTLHGPSLHSGNLAPVLAVLPFTLGTLRRSSPRFPSLWEPCVGPRRHSLHSGCLVYCVWEREMSVCVCAWGDKFLSQFVFSIGQIVVTLSSAVQRKQAVSLRRWERQCALLKDTTHPTAHLEVWRTNGRRWKQRICIFL